jgi:hypothetical protein
MKSNIRRVKDELDYLEDSIGEVLKILEDNSLTDSEKVEEAVKALEDIYD